jgi:hypothetical protein
MEDDVIVEDVTAEQVLVEAGLEKTFWGRIIIDAENNDEFDEADVNNAGDWTTCACGQQDSRLHRTGGIPLDSYLQDYGYKFNYAVNHNNFVLAAETLVDIEDRAAELLSRLDKPKTTQV